MGPVKALQTVEQTVFVTLGQGRSSSTPDQRYIKENTGQFDYLNIGYFCSLKVRKGNIKISQDSGKHICNTRTLDKSCVSRIYEKFPRIDKESPQSNRDTGLRPQHRSWLEQRWQIVAPKSLAQWVPAPEEAGRVQMEGEPQRGLMGGGDCSSGAPPSHLTRREMSQRALGSSSLGFLCGFRFCHPPGGQAVCGEAGKTIPRTRNMGGAGGGRGRRAFPNL